MVTARTKTVNRITARSKRNEAPVAMLAGLFIAPLRNLGYALAQVAEAKAKAEGA